ncbi:MAG: hypothetical protein ACOYCD_10465, partial [Kiritimatiellia bacterium]
ASSGAGCNLLGNIKHFKIVNCNISSNQAARFGGGVNSESGKMVLLDCLLANNSAVQYGGGIQYYHNGTNVAEIMNCTIRDNTVNDHYGGAGAYLRGPCRMVGCLVVSNVITSTGSRSAGGGIKIYSDSVVCENNTVVGNKTASGAGGGIYMESNGVVRSTIIYGNTSKAGANQDWGPIGTGTFYNCCTEDITDIAGAGNIAADPGFVDAAAGNYHLSAASPCVNAGLNQDWMAAAVDLDGRPRLDRFTMRVDIGCYEHHFRGAMFLVK